MLTGRYENPVLAPAYKPAVVGLLNRLERGRKGRSEEWIMRRLDHMIKEQGQSCWSRLLWDNGENSCVGFVSVERNANGQVTLHGFRADPVLGTRFGLANRYAAELVVYVLRDAYEGMQSGVPESERQSIFVRSVIASDNLDVVRHATHPKMLNAETETMFITMESPQRTSFPQLLKSLESEAPMSFGCVRAKSEEVDGLWEVYKSFRRREESRRVGIFRPRPLIGPESHQLNEQEQGSEFSAGYAFDGWSFFRLSKDMFRECVRNHNVWVVSRDTAFYAEEGSPWARVVGMFCLDLYQTCWIRRAPTAQIKFHARKLHAIDGGSDPKTRRLLESENSLSRRALMRAILSKTAEHDASQKDGFGLMVTASVFDRLPFEFYKLDFRPDRWYHEILIRAVINDAQLDRLSQAVKIK